MELSKIAKNPIEIQSRSLVPLLLCLEMWRRIRTYKNKVDQDF